MKKLTRHFTNGRLVYYRLRDPINWDIHWMEEISMDLFPPQPRGLGMLSFLAEMLPKKGKILEAGCGVGYIVHELRLQGFDCEGVDTAVSTIHSIRELMPNLPVSVGDVSHLDVPDNYYSGYISLGVVEHRQEGPEPFLTEAYRVLKKNGIAIFTVPYCNTIRLIKAKLGCFSSPPKLDEVFYQYAYTKNELIDLLQQHGFTIVTHTYYDPWKGLKDELQPFSAINRRPSLARKLRIWTDKRKWLYPHAAHMLVLICRKE